MTAEIMRPNRYVTCPACHAMNPSFEATCDQCGAPINDSSTASQSPPESVIEPKHFQPPTTIRLIGVWMISLPNVLGGTYFLFWLPGHFGGLAGFIIFWLTLGITCLWLFIFYRITRNYFLGPR